MRGSKQEPNQPLPAPNLGLGLGLHSLLSSRGIRCWSLKARTLNFFEVPSVKKIEPSLEAVQPYSEHILYCGVGSLALKVGV